MIKAVLPGTFDPPTLGHVNMVERASTLFDTLYVVIAVNRMKHTLFTDVERLEMLRELFSSLDNVLVMTWQGLVVDFASKHQVNVIIRGVRALVDFGYEFELAMTNKQLNPEIEVLFMPTDPKYFVLRSSAIKEMAMHGADISKMVPRQVAQALLSKLGN